MNRFAKTNVCISVFVCLATLAGSFAPVPAQTVGMVVARDRVVRVFDADTDTIIATVPLSSAGFTIGDCSITADGTTGFVTDFEFRVWVIDLAASPPALAAGINPIGISNNGEDTSITPDGKFLVVSDGSLNWPLSVVDIATRTQIGTFSFGGDHNSVEVGSDGSVIATKYNENLARRAVIDGTGNVTNTLQSVPSPAPNNVAIAPDAQSGVVITRAENAARSFLVSGMSPVDVRALGGVFGLCVAFNPAGDRLFTLSNSVVESYTYDSGTGSIGAAPLFSVPITGNITYFGMDQLAVHPDGSKIYASQGDKVTVHVASTGAVLSTLTTGPVTGVALRPGRPNRPPEILCNSPVILWSPNHDLMDVASAFTVTDPDEDPVTVTVTAISNELEVPEVMSGSGKHAPDFKDERGGRGLLVRAERAGAGNGRYYIFAIVADDGKGGVTEHACIAAVVPHDENGASLERVLQEAALARATVQNALDNDQTLPPPGMYQHGLAAPSGPKQ